MSAAPKSRLGRGLGSLIAKATPATAAKKSAAAPAPKAPPANTETLTGAPGYAEIAVSQIEPSPFQARREFTTDQLSELAESIRSEGLLQPIVVRKVGDSYQLIAGERRWRAFQSLKLKKIAARIVEANDGLLSLDAETQGFLGKGLLSVGHAKVLLGVTDAARRKLLARQIIEAGLSVRATEKLVQGDRSAVGGKKKRVAKGVSSKDAAAVANIEKKLTSHLGARSAVLHSGKKGRIVIEYNGNDDLQRVLAKIGVEL